MRVGALAYVVLAGTAALAARQPGRYTERVEVARVLIDVRVLDDHGKAARDLEVGDFEVKIGGKAARLESVQWVAHTPEDPAPLDSSALDLASAHQGRLIVFVFQKSLERSRIVGFMRMLISARGLLDTLTRRDRVAVLSFDSRLQIWLDFTNDFERVRRVFQRGILFERAPVVQERPGVSLIRRLDPERARRTYSIEAALRRIGEALEDLPGAKSIVLVGHGFGRMGLGGVVHMENEYDAMRDALQAARASVFSLDVTEADYHSLEAGLRLVAADTGGFFARTHIFHERALESLAGALAGHYVLFVEQPPLDWGTHGIEVKLARRKGTVLANRTYVIVSRDRPKVFETEKASRPARTSCPVTMRGENLFVPPSPYPSGAPYPRAFWYGTSSLWTMLPVNGRWTSLPRGDRGYRQKVFIWRPGYDGGSGQGPRLTVTGRRLDGDGPPLVVEEPTNAYHRDFGGWAMLAGVEVPAPGCWELTATYAESTLTFVLSVEP